MDRDWDLSAVVRSCSSSVSHRSFPPHPSNPANNFRNPHKAVAPPPPLVEEESPLACLASLTFEDDDQDSYLLPYPNISQPGKNTSLAQLATNQILSSTTGKSGTDYQLPDLVNPPPPAVATSVPGGVSIPARQLLLALSHAVTSCIGPQPPAASAAPTPALFFHQNPNLHHQQPQTQLAHSLNRILPDPAPILPSLPHPHLPRSKKRKVQQKRTVNQVTAEELTSSDQWAWRKYGQKPIKGSPYPRNYYRCSSSKGCSARKQVEQTISDPTKYRVTYTGEHTHPRPNYRNSLAGSTRNRVGSGQRSDGSSSTSPTAAAVEASSSQYQEIEELLLMEEVKAIVEVGSEEDDDDEDLVIPNLLIDDDDLFKGLEEFTAGLGFGRSPSFGDNFSASGDGNCNGNGTSVAAGGTTAGSD